MKLSRSALALALSASLLLSACSGTDDPGESTDAVSPTGSTSDGGDSTDGATSGDADSATATGDTAPSTGDGATSTGDATGDAAATTDDGKITAPAEGAGVISTEEAEEIASTLLWEAADSQNASGEEAQELNDSAFVGSELRAANAATKLKAAGLNPVIDYHPTSPNVLAISRADDQFPAYIVVQSVPESGLPELHLIVQDKAGADWKIGWSAPMLAGTEVGTFDPRTEGSPVLREGKGNLTLSPSQVVDRLFDILDYPFEEERPDFRTNDYGPQVRKAAEQQAASVSEQASLTQEHALRSGTLRTIQLADGSAISFPVLERTSTFDVYDGMILKPPAAFIHLANDDTITSSAQMTTLVFLAVHIPTGDGAPQVIAAREQVVDASGS